MFTWPWTSVRRLDTLQIELDILKTQHILMVDREAFEAVKSERDRLREQNDQLLDNIQRISRVEHGLAETARPVREDLGHMPASLEKYINSWDSAPLRREQKRQAWRMRGNGKSWEDIEITVRNPTEEDDAQ